MSKAQHTPRQMWEELKTRGNYTSQEIDAIDKETPWSEVEPEWWLEMMQARAAIAKAKGE